MHYCDFAARPQCLKETQTAALHLIALVLNGGSENATYRRRSAPGEYNADYLLKGSGRGVLSVDGGRIGSLNEG